MSDQTGASTPTLEERLRFEAVLVDLSSRFVNLPPHEVDGEIEAAQRRICECLGLELSALWQWSTEESADDLVMTHLFRALDGGPPVPERMLARESFPWTREQIMAGRTISFESLEESIPEDSADFATYRQFGVVSAVSFGLSAGGGEVFGVASFASMRRRTEWPDETVGRLQLVARRIHELSPRRDRPMVKVNCAVLPSNLVESELFGHEKGAYTGAVTCEAGRFEVAGEVVETKKMEKTLPVILQWDESFDIGSDTLTPINEADYSAPFKLTAKLHKLTLEIDRPELSPKDIADLEAAMHNVAAARE